MDETQKISVTVTTEDGSGVTRNYKMDDDEIQLKDWTNEIVGMVETLEESKKPL